MADKFEQFTSESWLERIRDSIKGVLVGGLLFLVSFPVLWWNEGRAVRTALSLEEGAGAVVAANADKVDAALDGKLVHVTGALVTKGPLADDALGVTVNALRLSRTVEMYQWNEEVEEKKDKKLGGGTETQKTYTYEKDWDSELVDSTEFKKPKEHVNPKAMPLLEQELTAKDVTLGAFSFPDRLVERVGTPTEVKLDAAALEKLAPPLKAKARLEQGYVYLGANPAQPEVGDVRIKLYQVAPMTVSVVSRQRGNTFEPYQAKAGDALELVREGDVPAAAMFQSAQAGNSMMTWILRVIGFLLMAFGVGMVFRPLATLGDVVPLVGSMLGFGAGVFAFVVSIMLSSITIAVAWLFHRPLVAVLMLVAAGLGGAALAGMRHRQKTLARVQQGRG